MILLVPDGTETACPWRKGYRQGCVKDKANGILVNRTLSLILLWGCDLDMNFGATPRNQSSRAWGDGISWDTLTKTHRYLTSGFIPSVMEPAGMEMDSFHIFTFVYLYHKTVYSSKVKYLIHLCIPSAKLM